MPVIRAEIVEVARRGNQFIVIVQYTSDNEPLSKETFYFKRDVSVSEIDQAITDKGEEFKTQSDVNSLVGRKYEFSVE